MFGRNICSVKVCPRLIFHRCLLNGIRLGHFRLVLLEREITFGSSQDTAGELLSARSLPQQKLPIPLGALNVKDEIVFPQFLGDLAGRRDVEAERFHFPKMLSHDRVSAVLILREVGQHSHGLIEAELRQATASEASDNQQAADDG